MPLDPTERLPSPDLWAMIIIIIIIIETAGTWHDTAIELTQEICRRISAVTEDNRETTFLFQRLFIALQRGNAVSFQNTMNTT